MTDILNNKIKQKFFRLASRNYKNKQGITSEKNITQAHVNYLSRNINSNPHRYYVNRHYYDLDHNTLKEFEDGLIVNMFNGSHNRSVISNNNLNGAFNSIINNIDDLDYQLKGIYNFGNTCYFNISIQLLLRCIDIVKLLLRNENIY